MKLFSPAEGVTRLVLPSGENGIPGPVCFGPAERPFLRLESCRLSPREVYGPAEETGGQVVRTANGETVAGAAGRLRRIRTCRRAELVFSCRGGQVLTGLGQHERGILDYAREREWLYEHNMKIPVPFLLGGDGWGLRIHADCAMTYEGYGDGFRLALNAADDLVLTAYEGKDCAEVLKKLAADTGLPAMLPKWAFGYIQSKERYRSAAELLETAEEFRRRGLGLDCIVLDWLSWREGCWGDKTPDPERFPSVRALTDALHGMDVRLMVSVWPNTVKGRDCDEFASAGLFLPGIRTYDAFSAEARELYWQQVRRGWMDGGTDALWCDSCEPITDPDWCGKEKREEGERMRLLTEEAEIRMDPARMNAYGEEHIRGLDEHWRRDFPEKRTMILARSGGLTSAAHGAVLWSGDICATWETLRRQVTEAVRSAMSGLHYWTLDIGGFFAGRNEPWFWRGDYPDGVGDPGYRELYTRWFQFGALLPLFRSHGTDTPREPWRFGEYYGCLEETVALRYQLIPYLYATAAQACRTGLPMLRGMPVAFGDDPDLRACGDTYMLGDALLVKPVCLPLEKGGNRTRVRLPRGAGWYNWFTRAFHAGGQEITEETPMDRFPLYVRAGSVLPLAEDPARSTADLPLPARTLAVFTGADGSFDWYDDAGDGRNREESLLIPVRWREEERTLRLGKQGGSLSVRAEIAVRFISPDGAEEKRMVLYEGEETPVSL